MIAGCGTYNTNRAALVPRATPRMTSGQPLDGRGQLGIGASSVANLGKPRVGDPNAGIEIPGTQLHGDLRARIGESFSLGILYEHGMDQGATKLKSTQPDVDGGPVSGYGISMDMSIRTGDPRFRIGIGVDTIVWSVPYVEYLTCAAGEECFPYMIEGEGRDTVTTFAASITPSYRASDDIVLFAGATVRQHPTLPQKGTVTDPGFDEVEVQSGPANFLVSGGAELSLADGGLLASAVAYWDVSRDPAKYKPGIGVQLSIPLGKHRSRTQAQPMPHPQPMPYPTPMPPPQPMPPPPPMPQPAPY